MAIETQAIPTFAVDPREGTVAGPGGSVRLEPKVMEVLAVLARHPGHVVSRNELLEQAWPGAVVTEHTLSRCIYQLRHQLGKIGSDPDQTEFNPIETLPKRGYRLLATFETPSSAPVANSGGASCQLPAIPYVVGQWVRGDRFYGRTAQIQEILEGHRDCLWLLGTRRIGKTSLLKQIEHIAATSRNQRYFPIYWDFQGAESAAELNLNFTDGLLDAEERLARIGISLEDVEAVDLFVALERLRRRLRSENLKLLLLCDEVEELIGLQRTDPSLLRKLRHAMQRHQDIRTVLASTIRLWALAEHREDTSPFLHGFSPPLYIERFSDEETRSLIGQTHLTVQERPRLAREVVESIRQRCDNHPYLVQLVCKRYLESGNLDEAIEQVATDDMVSYFFSVDFEMLSATEADVVRRIARQPGMTSDSICAALALGSDALEGTLRRLENLGFLRRDDERRFTVANYFFRHWLEETQAAAVSVLAPAVPTATTPQAQAAPSGDDRPPVRGLFAEMKRRNVVRVAIAYVLIAWVLLQVAEIVLGFLEVPVWAGKLLIVFLALGLPIALFLAWAFELTPEGVKRERDVDRTTGTAHQAGRKLDFVIIAILAIAVAFFAFDKFF